MGDKAKQLLYCGRPTIRVLYAPLIVFMLASLLLVALGVTLTILVILSAGGHTAEAQACLSIQAIVAQSFEGSLARRGVNSTATKMKPEGWYHQDRGVWVDVWVLGPSQFMYMTKQKSYN